jgi:S-adenosylmethionine decarboxylase proenzyme
MQGLHLTADLHGCAVERPAMTEPGALRTLCLRAAEAAGLRAVGELFHRFEVLPACGSAPPGITGVVLLAESHLTVHTWPEVGAVTLDVYVCNIDADNSQRAHTALEVLIAAFTPQRIERHSLRRGQLAALDQPVAPA